VILTLYKRKIAFLLATTLAFLMMLSGCGKKAAGG
jgi:hypothetical protein